MNKHLKVKCNVNDIKLEIDSDDRCTPVAFSLLNSGDGISFKISSVKSRQYEIDPRYGTILKGHCIEISLSIQNILPDYYLSDDLIVINIFSKDKNSCLQRIELPVTIVSFNQTPSIISMKQHELRKRYTRSSVSSIQNYNGESPKRSNLISSSSSLFLSHTNFTWIFKKILFLLVCSISVIAIVLPLKGYPIPEPNPLDNWVNHLARIWPPYLLPNHLIQYTAIMFLGASIALFLFTF